MRNYILCLFNKRNEREDFYFSAPESIEFPFCRFDLKDLKHEDRKDDRWENVKKLFEDNDILSYRIYVNAEEFLILPYHPKPIKFS